MERSSSWSFHAVLSLLICCCGVCASFSREDVSRDILRRVERERDKIVLEIKDGQFVDSSAEEKAHEYFSRVRRQAAPAPPGKSSNASQIAWPVRAIASEGLR